MIARGADQTSASLFARAFVPDVGILIAAIGFGFTLFGADLFTGDGDVGRHVRVGREILRSGSIPNTDLFSHTMAGEKFVPFEWLSEVTFALADGAAGLMGVAVLTAVLFGCAVWLCYHIARLTGAGPLLAGLTAGLGLLLIDVHLLPRPHLYTVVFAGLF